MLRPSVMPPAATIGTFTFDAPDGLLARPGEHFTLALDDEVLRRAAWQGYGRALVGLLLGLAIALGVALYISKVPVPFVNKAPSRTAEMDAAEAERNKNWDPNAPLYGNNPAKPKAVPVPTPRPSPVPTSPPSSRWHPSVRALPDEFSKAFSA